MKIKNVKVYGLEESIIRSGYPMQTGEPGDIYEVDGGLLDFLDERNHTRAKKLAKTPVGSGHNNFLIGITVQFDLCYPQYWTKHLQRYHWFQYFSGQSLMHKLTAVKDVKSNCNRYVHFSVADLVDDLILAYNSDTLVFFGNKTDYIFKYESKEELFHAIISNCPMGYELWIPVTTNYLQLKTMYFQRKNHKLEDWKEFCSFIESLPMAKKLILCEG